MTVATDPIQIAALVATLQEATAKFQEAEKASKEAQISLSAARNAVVLAQKAIDTCVDALRTSDVWGSPWHKDAKAKETDAVLGRVKAQYQRDQLTKTLSLENLAKDMGLPSILRKGP